MVKDEILTAIKLRPGVSNLSDALLEDLICTAYLDVSEYINLQAGAEMPPVCINIVKELVLISINRLGSEGLASESHEGIGQSYIDGLPKSLKDKLRRQRRLPY